ncbi:hypothetical protein G6F70_002339 [Rhizopus microsporus]|nr:hypothetical protein G6F71_004492 [Rhizopus microsporus]KAG1202348.1 hypothetical protein G6F70_002339 [Rhizopus microsporus]KAG1214123.1 hypothetical protein G6F69_002206 [Rhizopus microsporus]KAG1236509.1 hypothetical protein G6F67_001934 [Rhizopus microsporus]KAG1265546.1 hypothetical protein G6F68_003473 [Rhizopus microsporus]
MPEPEKLERKIHPLPFQFLYQEILWANRTVIAASAAAVVGVISGYPVKHVSNRPIRKRAYKGFLEASIIPPLITVSIIKSISFSVYEQSKAFCKQYSSTVFDQNTLPSTMTVSTTAGSVSGAFIASLSCPFELVKIQKQLEYLLQASSISTGDLAMVRPVNNDLKPTISRTVGAGLPVTPTSSPPQPRNTSHCITHKRTLYTSTSSWHSAKEILKKRGPLGLYSGFSLHLARDAIGTGVYFGGYETTKYLLSHLQNTTAGPDLVKSLIQKEILHPFPKYKSTKQCVQEIYQRNGIAGFYRGISVTLIRAFPIHSLNFLVYEQTLVLVRHLSNH